MIDYLTNVKSRLHEKLNQNQLEMTKLNIFTLLVTSTVDYM